MQEVILRPLALATCLQAWVIIALPLLMPAAIPATVTIIWTM